MQRNTDIQLLSFDYNSHNKIKELRQFADNWFDEEERQESKVVFVIKVKEDQLNQQAQVVTEVEKQVVRKFETINAKNEKRLFSEANVQKIMTDLKTGKEEIVVLRIFSRPKKFETVNKNVEIKIEQESDFVKIQEPKAEVRTKTSTHQFRFLKDLPDLIAQTEGGSVPKGKFMNEEFLKKLEKDTEEFLNNAAESLKKTEEKKREKKKLEEAIKKEEAEKNSFRARIYRHVNNVFSNYTGSKKENKKEKEIVESTSEHSKHIEHEGKITERNTDIQLPEEGIEKLKSQVDRAQKFEADREKQQEAEWEYDNVKEFAGVRKPENKEVISPLAALKLSLSENDLFSRGMKTKEEAKQKPGLQKKQELSYITRSKTKQEELEEKDIFVEEKEGEIDQKLKNRGSMKKSG